MDIHTARDFSFLVVEPNGSVLDGTLHTTNEKAHLAIREAIGGRRYDGALPSIQQVRFNEEYDEQFGDIRCYVLGTGYGINTWAAPNNTKAFDIFKKIAEDPSSRHTIRGAMVFLESYVDITPEQPVLNERIWKERIFKLIKPEGLCSPEQPRTFRYERVEEGKR